MLGSVILGTALQSERRHDAAGPKDRERAEGDIAVTAQGCRLEGWSGGSCASHDEVAGSVAYS